MRFGPLLHVTTLWILLLVFFVMYASKIEAASFSDQLKRLLHDPLKTLANALPAVPPGMLDGTFKAYSQPDPRVTQHNRWLFIMAAAFGLWLVWMCVQKSHEVPTLILRQMIKREAIIFAFIAIIEYLMFKHVVLKFIPVPPNAIAQAAADQLSK